MPSLVLAFFVSAIQYWLDIDKGGVRRSLVEGFRLNTSDVRFVEDSLSFDSGRGVCNWPWLVFALIHVKTTPLSQHTIPACQHVV
jgi:hypothetical protein